jgi:hypothetical protein
MKIVSKAIVILAIFCTSVWFLKNKNAPQEITTTLNSRKKLFVIHQFCAAHPWAPSVDRGLREEISDFDLDIKSIYCEEHKDDPTIVESLLDSFQPDVVVIDDDTMADLVGEKIVNKGYKIFFSNSYRNPNDIKWVTHNRDRVTVTLQNPRIIDAISVMEELISNKIQDISIIGGDGLSAKLLCEVMEAEIKSKMPGIRVKSDLIKDFLQWKKSIVEASSSDAVIALIPFHIVDEETANLVSWDKAGQFLKENLWKPTIGITACSGGFPRLMSFSVDPYIVGRQTGSQLYRFFMGDEIIDIPFEKYFSHSLEINKSEVERLKISVPEKLVQYIRY